MGNASRVVATLEALRDWADLSGLGIDYHVASWGAGFDFLDAYQSRSSFPIRLIKLKPPFFSFFSNASLLRREIRNLSPDLILLDSDYHFPAFIGVGVPRCYLGQAIDVVARGRRHGINSWKQRLNFFFKEKLDALFQRVFADTILAPCFIERTAVKSGVHHIPLIVRHEFRRPVKPTANNTVGILLSGSRMERSAFSGLEGLKGFEILESVPSTAAALDRCGTVFVQGGMSSIAECIARERFAVIFPMRDHPEQILNAREVEKLGLGLMADPEELADLPRLLERVRLARENFPAKSIECAGAEAAARILGQRLMHLQGQFSTGPFFKAVNGLNSGARPSGADL